MFEEIYNWATPDEVDEITAEITFEATFAECDFDEAVEMIGGID